jgi:hypothetical protein
MPPQAAYRVALSASLAVLAACSIATRAGAAGGAYAVDDVNIAPLNTCQVESWASIGANTDRVFASAPACTVGIFVPVELKYETQRLRADRFWATTVNLQGKVNIRPMEVGKIGLGMSLSATVDATADNVAAIVLNVPMTYAATDQLRFHVNAGAVHSPASARSWATWGVAFEWEFVKRLTWLGETFGMIGPRLPGAPALTEPRAQTGLRYTPIEAVDIDLIYGRNITGTRTHWVTVGLTARFGNTD